MCTLIHTNLESKIPGLIMRPYSKTKDLKQQPTHFFSRTNSSLMSYKTIKLKTKSVIRPHLSRKESALISDINCKMN